MSHALRALLSSTIPGACVILALTQPTASAAGAEQSASGDSHIQDIIVTAQKREQSINSVGLTVTAASANTLLQRGVTDTADLAKIAPGFTFTRSAQSTPVYTLRGIGLYDYSFGSSPSVAVYVDEFSLPYPLMTSGATLDLERVEVLKGPQGTLFGQSSTGGAINYIAAKPTSTFEAGADITYERFGKIDTSGFVSGPLSSTLKARLALRAVEGGNWQYSISRPDDENGAADQLYGRLLLDFEPSEALTFHLNVNGWRDKSDLQQAQFILNALNTVAAPDPRNPAADVDPAGFAALNNPASPNYDPSFNGRQATVFNRAGAGEPGSIAYLGGPNGDGSRVSENARKAEWGNYPTHADDSFYQIALRGDYKLSDQVTLSSLTSYQKVKINRYMDDDATTAVALDENVFGTIKYLSQELRLSGNRLGFHWMLGTNYERSKINDTVFFNAIDLSLNEALPGLRFNDINSNIKQTVKNHSVFANAEYKISGNLKILGGFRYTDSRRNAANFDTQPFADQNLSKTFGNATIVPGFGFYDIQTLIGLPASGHVVVQPGQSYVLNDTVLPTDPAYLRPTLLPFAQKLMENNVSFRAGMNYKFEQGTLLYVAVSQGYKSGIISGISPSVTSQYAPATQEKLIAYEGGFKAPLFDRKIQLNGAAFYYDYRNKQVRARVRDNIFGLLETLVNVPKSYVWGLEAELTARPVPGLSLSASGTYLKSKVTSSFSTVPNAIGVPRVLYNQAGYTGDFKGSELPYTPHFSGVFDGQYEFPVFNDKKAFIGTTITYAGRDNTTFHNTVLNADEFFRRAHTLVDIRAGLSGGDGAWRLTAFGRNIFNKFYETTYFQGIEALYRYSGRPATYGLTLSVRTR